MQVIVSLAAGTPGTADCRARPAKRGLLPQTGPRWRVRIRTYGAGNHLCSMSGVHLISGVSILSLQVLPTVRHLR